MVEPTLRSTRVGAPAPTIDVSATVAAAEQHVAPQGQNTVDETAADEFEAALAGEQSTASPTMVAAPAVAAPVAVAAQLGGPFAALSDGTLLGDWDSTDVRFPALRIVNGSGPLTKTYNQGTLLLGDDVLFDAPDPRKPETAPLLRVVPLTLRKRFRQNLTPEEQAGGAMPNIVDTPQEVEALGGSLVWINNVKPSWSPCAVILALVEQPKDSQHPGFSVEIGGKLYASALYYASGTAYASSAKLIFNAALSVLQEPVLDPETGKPKTAAGGFILKRPYLSKRFWTLRVVKRSFAKGQQEFTVFTPEMRLTNEDTQPELRTYISELLRSVDINRASTVGGE